MKTMKIKMAGYGLECTLSEGNSKMGKILNWSLPPGRTCSPEACKTCLKEGCYAMRLYRSRPPVKKCWDKNLEAVNVMAFHGLLLGQWVWKMSEAIKKKGAKVVRIHVSGDFYSRDYFKAWIGIAMACPDTQFFAFTKQWGIVKGIHLPDNFSLIASEWAGCSIPKYIRARLPIAHVVGKNEQVPVRKGVVTKMCAGDCTRCQLCFTLKHGTDVAFMKH